MRRRGATALAAALAGIALCPAVAAARQAGPSPDGVVRSFYAYHMKHNAGFTWTAVSRRARWLTPQLVASCRAYFAKPSPADEVPAIDGDPFTDSQDYPDTYRVGGTAVSGDTAHVSVTFRWTGGDRRDVSVVLVRAAGAWRIDDVRSGAEPSLRELLVAEP